MARWRSGNTPADNARQVAAVLKLADATSTPAPATDAEPTVPAAALADALGTPVIVALLVVTCMFGFGTFAAIALDSAYTPLDRGPLLLAATALAAVASVGWGWVSWRAWRLQARDYRAWLPMMVVAVPAFWVVAYAAAVGINGAADNAAPSLIEGEAGTHPGRLGVPWRKLGSDIPRVDEGR